MVVCPSREVEVMVPSVPREDGFITKPYSIVVIDEYLNISSDPNFWHCFLKKKLLQIDILI